jgi:Dolichyl-phosphate-mannose-protein mannosyltransferase
MTMAREPYRWLLPLLLGLCMVRLWLMPLPSSFWLDETATIFVAQQGAGHPSVIEAGPQSWHSWYYPAMRINGTVFGYSEIASRAPSVLAMAGLLALVAALARRLIHPRAAWFAVFACLALPGINYQAANARPYAAGMFCFVAAALFLVRWLDSARWRDALLFVACAALTLHIHLMFWPSCVLFLLYAALALAAGNTPVRRRGAILIFGVWAAALLPVILDTLSLFRQARTHVVAPLPSFTQFLRSLELTLVLGCAAAAWLLMRVWRWPRNGTGTSPAALVLIGGWWLCQPVLLYAFSWVTGESVFVPRYLQLALPGAALAATAAAAWFVPARQWPKLAAALGLGVLLLGGHWGRLWPLHHNSDWRAAAVTVNQLEAAGDIPVICPSAYIEARPPVWRPDYPLPGFLYTQLYVYPIQAPTYLFPFEDSPAADGFAASLSAGTLRGSQRFLIYGWQPQVDFWRDWFAKRPEFQGWRQKRLGPFADVDVVLFYL